MTALGFLDLPARQQQEIIDHVKGSLALIRKPIAVALGDRVLEDICRYAIDGYRRSSLVEDAYAEGYDDGVAHAIAVGNGETKAAGG